VNAPWSFATIFRYTVECARCGNLAHLATVPTPAFGAIFTPSLPQDWHEVDRQPICRVCWERP
jgi:hypothetical protein